MSYGALPWAHKTVRPTLRTYGEPSCPPLGGSGEPPYMTERRTASVMAKPSTSSSRVASTRVPPRVPRGRRGLRRQWCPVGAKGIAQLAFGPVSTVDAVREHVIRQFAQLLHAPNDFTSRPSSSSWGVIVVSRATTRPPTPATPNPSRAGLDQNLVPVPGWPDCVDQRQFQSLPCMEQGHSLA